MLKVISDTMAHWNDMWNSNVIQLISAIQNKCFCALMFIITIHCGIKYVSNLLQLETVEFYVYSDFRLNGTLVCDVKYNCYCSAKQRKWFVCLS